ncbi:hypothetical protein EPUL_006034 [Erysiphe pulchra]|uniref:Uncharacterized protein n=1 Tax=Erysiphe pulchra TaxID=225359 RepID=A0A2S4PKR2_9PEZI|nr:hypothetical protein EPUL_006034 [Erysiphe pulchra]
MAKQNESQEIDVQSTGTIPPRPTCSSPKIKIPKTPQSPPALNICRNKHWRYISSFHGSWLQLPLEVLESLAQNNYNLPRPRPIDPAVFFDILKIRQLVEDATNLSVGASSGVALSPSENILKHSNGRLSYENMLGIGVGGRVVNTKLSKERKHRMREKATQKLSKAYHLDEIACSVATMQSASTLENVAQLVLQRNSNNIDAKYVHFFHEKIPSRQLSACTTLQSLNEIIAEHPSRCEILRTRAVTKIFKEDLIGAAQDLTSALQICKFYQNQSHPTNEVAIEANCKGECIEDLSLDDAHQPSGLVTQLLFHRAGVYLSIACQNVDDSLLSKRSASVGRSSNLQSVSSYNLRIQDEKSVAEIKAQQTWPKARRNVKNYAKKALKDYLAYLSHFDYTPGLPGLIQTEAKRYIDKISNNYEVSGSQICKIKNCNSQINDSQDGAQNGAHSVSLPAVEIYPRPKVHDISSLFSATPPRDLPPYPETPASSTKQKPQSKCNELSKPTWTQSDSFESLTYHPLMTDALHSLLLCHCLIQTSVSELKRHAYMVSRLARICNGYPIFQTPRSPSRADWVEILRRCENWIQLSSPWESLCDLEYPPGQVTLNSQKKMPTREHMVFKQNDSSKLSQESRIDNDVSVPIPSFARQLDHEKGANKVERRENFNRWVQETGKEYPLSTERAYTIIRWIKEAPPSDGFCALKEKRIKNKLINRSKSGINIVA